jgi:DNA-binding CsgD family transcriptional regulator/tetratricopeptide (TPR) repeat protein
MLLPGSSRRHHKIRTGARVGMSAISPAQRWLVRAVAVSATPCELWFVERMVERSGLQLAGDLEHVLARGVLRDTPDGLRPASAAIHAEVLRATPPSLLSGLRQRAAQVLAAAGLPSRAAQQLLRAVNAGCRIDLDFVSELAGSPSVDPSIAADLLMALRARLAPMTEPDRRRAWMLTTVDNLMLVGRSQQALELLTEELAADRDAAQHRAALLGRLGAWHATERPSQALQHLRSALAQDRLAPSDRTWLLAVAASVASRVGHPETADLIRRAKRSQTTSPTPDGDVRLALARSAVASSRGDLPAARRALSLVDPCAPAARPYAGALRAERIILQIARREFEDARTAVGAAAGEVGSLGAAVEAPLTALGCLLRVAVGELPEAQAQAGLALRQHPHRPLPGEVRAQLLAVVAEVLFRRGQPGQARDLLRPTDASHDWPDSAPWVLLYCAAAADPDPARHVDLFQAAVGVLSRTARPLVLLPHQAARLVRTALRLGDQRSARTITGHATAIAARTGTALWRGVAQHTSGLVERDPAALREAVARLRTTGARPALAEALLDLARLPRVPTAEAHAAVAESAALFGRLGATGDQEKAQQWAAELGTASRRRRSTTPSHGFAALTTREVRVAELVAAGATKQQAAARLYVSFHTVDTHLRSVYAKLGIRTRVQLARLWDNRESQPHRSSLFEG